jgi:hypothetical protein
MAGELPVLEKLAANRLQVSSYGPLIRGLEPTTR